MPSSSIAELLQKALTLHRGAQSPPLRPPMARCCAAIRQIPARCATILCRHVSVLGEKAAVTEHPAFQRAMACLRAGHAKDAEHSFELVLREQPRHLAALNLLAVLLTQLGRFAEAETYLRRALQENSNSDATLYNYAVVLKALNRPAEALERLTRALKINPNSAETWNRRGTTFVDLKASRRSDPGF